ncbi:MAG: hydroxymethylbilane synthase, partial [Verrucomicrobiota bacterium]|nr:hydroxymethylbilane synthase [Verrucomicrobiota bacterium]
RKGLFTAEIERALLEVKIDVAVHSAKDLPSSLTSGSEICATLPRANVEDVLVAKNADSLATVAKGATVGTGSVRRQHQLRWLRPDLQIADLRGNVPTRLRKLAENSWEAIILARAGLERLQIANDRYVILPNEQFVPAGGQGVIALQIRRDDNGLREMLAPINHHATFLCLRAEREFLRLLQGDCGTPVGVLAQIEGEWMNLCAQVFSESETEPKVGRLRERITAQPEAIAATLFESMYGKEK